MSNDVLLLSHAVKDVLREILGIVPPSRNSADVGCTVDYVLINPHAFVNLILMIEQDPTILSKFRARLTEILKHENGS